MGKCPSDSDPVFCHLCHPYAKLCLIRPFVIIKSALCNNSWTRNWPPEKAMRTARTHAGLFWSGLIIPFLMDLLKAAFSSPQPIIHLKGGPNVFIIWCQFLDEQNLYQNQVTFVLVSIWQTRRHYLVFCWIYISVLWEILALILMIRLKVA